MWKHISEWWQAFVKARDLAEAIEIFKEERARRENVPDDQAERFLKGPKTDDLSWTPSKSMSVGQAFFGTETYLRQYDRADWRTVDYRMQLFAARLVEAARRRNVPLYVHTAFRTPAEQARLVEAGRSQTRPPTAAHCQGYAVDIVHSIHHWNMTEREWQAVGNLGHAVARQMSLKVQWGGAWKNFYDPAHWEIKDWRAEPQKSYKELQEVVGLELPVRKCPRAIINLGPRN